MLVPYTLSVCTNNVLKHMTWKQHETNMKQHETNMKQHETNNMKNHIVMTVARIPTVVSYSD